jgi:hypothetical protein
MRKERKITSEPILTARLNPACEPSWLPKHNSANLVDWPRRPTVAEVTKTRVSTRDPKFPGSTESQ